MVVTERIEVATQGQNACLDITKTVKEVIARAGIRNGIVTVFVAGSTAALALNEHEPGLVSDIQSTMRRLVPEDVAYKHHETGGDRNGHSHLRAILLNPSLAIPLVEGRLALGAWQQVLLFDFDLQPRVRPVVVQVVGE